MAELTLNLYAHNESLYFGVIAKDENKFIVKKNVDLDILSNTNDFKAILNEELSKVGIRQIPAQLNIIESNSDFLKKEEASIGKLFKNIIRTDIQSALKNSYFQLDNQTDNPVLIAFLDSECHYSVIDNGKSVLIEDTISHSSIDDLGRECECGKLGCLIQYASPKGLVRTAQEKIEFYSGPTQFSDVVPRELKFKKLVQYTKKGDPLAIEILNATLSLLTPKIVDLAIEQKVNKVILSGRLGQFGKLISKPIQSQISEKRGKTTPVLTPFSKSFEETFVSINFG